ncbi:SLAC1 anion channel family protein [Campylobacter sp. RM16187]|uniref:SLAC1 anion channel family protein n=1 Tax=Campylobacter sp. RM16187 TaxID=1660063 RepID=UPI0021B6C957|nr:SLAC1 anion channel family protein [Campylobacter sp. RM16187]QKG29093.1 tellurite-resistance/dicarboxylate transporter (TDT) family protein [Campylobacter sp. RM16187]
MDQAAITKNQISKISNFPIMLYAIIMGLGGLTLAYEKLNLVVQISDFLFEILRLTTSLIFVIITIIYSIKIIKYKEEVKAEINHPIKINFFAAFAISLFLLAALWRDIGTLHYILFYIALIFQTFFTFYVIAFWINKNMLINHSNPAWFIPIVGNLIVVIASESKSEFLWYYFSIGVFFWIVLFTIIFYRIIFHDQLAQKFMPTLFIFIAPPAVAFLGYMKLTGSFDTFAHILLNLTLFFVGLIFFMYKNFMKLKFFLSWWAFTFPTAAASIAFIRAYELNKGDIFLCFGILAFIFLLFFIGVVSYFTVKAIKNNEICVAE